MCSSEVLYRASLTVHTAGYFCQYIVLESGAILALENILGIVTHVRPFPVRIRVVPREPHNDQSFSPLSILPRSEVISDEGKARRKFGMAWEAQIIGRKKREKREVVVVGIGGIWSRPPYSTLPVLLFPQNFTYISSYMQFQNENFVGCRRMKITYIV